MVQTGKTTMFMLLTFSIQDSLQNVFKDLVPGGKLSVELGHQMKEESDEYWRVTI